MMRSYQISNKSVTAGVSLDSIGFSENRIL